MVYRKKNMSRTGGMAVSQAFRNHTHLCRYSEVMTMTKSRKLTNAYTNTYLGHILMGNVLTPDRLKVKCTHIILAMTLDTFRKFIQNEEALHQFGCNMTIAAVIVVSTSKTIAIYA